MRLHWGGALVWSAIALVACTSSDDAPARGDGGSAGASTSTAGSSAGSSGTAGSAGAAGSSGSRAGGSAAGRGGSTAMMDAMMPPEDGSAPASDAAVEPDAVVDAGPALTGPDVDRSDPKLHEFAFEPQDLDPSASDSLETEYASLDTRAEPLGKLVIFLGGFTNPPAAWQNHGRKLAEFGFHVVLPAYNNRWESCSGPNCNENTRWEALTGEDASTAIVASRADSVEGRVITILKHLVTEHPGGDWGHYLDGDALRFERIIIAGISHGAANTGVYAARRGFWRAVMHSGGWGNPGDAPATPLTEWYGLAHTGDESFDPIVDTWDDAGMLGERTSIDGQTSPYGGAHKLITSEANSYPHCSVAVHSSSPMSGGEYVFEPAWRHLYGVAALSR